MSRKRSVHGVFFVVGLSVLHVGAVLGLLGAWSLSSLDTGVGANIGGGIAVMLGTVLVVVGLLLEGAALVARSVGRRGSTGRGSTGRSSTGRGSTGRGSP